MYMVYILIGITMICALLCTVELLVRVWEKAARRARASRPVVYAAAAPAVRSNVTRIPVSGCLPDREAVSNIYSLSDHFADRFREVVNS